MRNKEKIEKLINKSCKLVGNIIYPIVLLLIGFMFGHKDIIIEIEGSCSFWGYFIVAIVILINSIILKHSFFQQKKVIKNDI